METMKTNKTEERITWGDADAKPMNVVYLKNKRALIVHRDKDETIEIADDLTLDEAKETLRTIAKETTRLVKLHSKTRDFIRAYRDES